MSVHAEQPRLCFVAHNAYGELAGVDNGHIGGIERQQAMMARYLAKRGYNVSVITWDEGQPDSERIGGVTIHKLCTRHAGARILRFVTPRWTSLCSAMRKANADIYYYNCGDFGLGQVVLWCKRNRRGCVYSVANNPDCEARLPSLGPLRERVLYRYGLRHVDHIVVQTSWQQSTLRTSFDVASVVIPMPGEMPSDATIISAPHDLHPPQILWVGRLSEPKRLEWLLDIAERNPELAFDVVGSDNCGSSYGKALVCRARGISNVSLLGRVDRAGMVEMYRRATLLCCTSTHEGFPNTFLEAWSVGLPVVTSFDPDGVVARHGMGAVAEDIAGLTAGLKRMTSDRAAWLDASRSARAYFEKNHVLENVMPKFESVFLDLFRNGSPK